MKEIFEDNKEQKGERVLGEEERKLLIEKIKEDNTLDPDTRQNVILASILFHVNYDDAIKIAETVNLLWEGNKRFEDEGKNEKYSFKTPSDDVFVKKIFPVAKEYKDAETIEDIPKEVLEDIFEFKTNYKVLSELKTYVYDDEKKLKLYNFVKQKFDNQEKCIAGEDSEWNEIIEKLDEVDRDIKDIMDSKEKYSKEIEIVGALIKYENKQNRIKERAENGFGIKGFENSEVVSNDEIKNFLFNTFSKERLAKSQISEIVYSSKYAISDKDLNDSKESMYITEDEYINLEKEESNLEENRRFLGEAYADGFIYIYNHKYRDTSKYAQLKNISSNNKIEALFFGTVTHEIAHRFYDEILKLSERKEYERIWREVEAGYVSEYAKKRNSPREDFSESMKRFMTDYEDFKREFPKRAEFIEIKFPEIIENGIRKFVENEQQ